MYNNNQFSLDLGENFEINGEYFFENIIIDRKSKYSITAIKVENIEEVKSFLDSISHKKFYKKASHNSYAFIIKDKNGLLLERKNDDGETGAGMCILRELKRKNAINTLFIVTRYFGGIHLNADRFKNVINSCKLFFEKYENR